MVFVPSFDLAAADWIVGSELPWSRLVTFGPSGFPAHARVRQIPDPIRPGQSENDAQADPDRPTESAQAVAVLQVLGRHTRAPDDCYLCIWDGWGIDLPRSNVDVPNRRYGLFRGPLSELGGAAMTSTGLNLREVPRLAFVWPADHAWCLAHDVDPHWMGVGASTQAVTELLSDPLLDAVEADPTRAQPRYDAAGPSAPRPGPPSSLRLPRRYQD